MLPGGASDEPEAVRYLSQHFVEKLCSSAGLATELRSAMERVVFESTDSLERLEAETFDELAERLLEPIRTTCTPTCRHRSTPLAMQSCRKKSSAMADDDDAGARSACEKDRERKEGTAEADSKGQRGARKASRRTGDSVHTAQGKVETLRRRLKTIEDLRAAATHLTGAAEPTRFTAMQQKYAGAELTRPNGRPSACVFPETPAPPLQPAKAVPKQR